MSTRQEKSIERKIGIALRPTTPQAIVENFENGFDTQVRVKYAPKGETITISDGWHGAGKEGEVLVEVGDLLTKPISGTKLEAKDLLLWSSHEKFSIMDGQNNILPINEAIELLVGNENALKNPLLRMTRAVSGKTPVEIQFYGGATNPRIAKLSAIGNRPFDHVTEVDKKTYRNEVQELIRPFISKGTKVERSRLGLTKNVDVLRRVDDCTASGVTFMGDQLLDDAMQISRDNLIEVHDVVVASVQSVVVAIAMADRRRVPLIMRIGAPSFGLGSRDKLNYMVNTLPQMQIYGPLTVGDMGTLMDEGESRAAKPQLVEARSEDASREMRLFLGGGLPISKMIFEEHDKKNKPVKWDIAIRRASRVDNGPDHWGVLISGTDVTVRTARRDKVFIKPDTELTDHENMPYNVGPDGLWASLGKEEGGLIPLMFVDRGTIRTLWLPAKEK